MTVTNICKPLNQTQSRLAKVQILGPQQELYLSILVGRTGYQSKLKGINIYHLKCLQGQLKTFRAVGYELELELFVRETPGQRGEFFSRVLCFIQQSRNGKISKFNPFQPSAALYIETSCLFCIIKQMSGFYMKRNNG